MKTNQIEIAYGFFCEMVRVEASGQITPVGIWGEGCTLAGKPPLILPSLAFHAFVKNLGKESHKFKFKVIFPGTANPIEIEEQLGGGAGHTSQNLNFHMAGVPLSAPGDIVATLHLDTTPPVEREFRLKVDFQPQAKPVVN